MTRSAFAVAVPALLAAIVTFMIGYAIALGFQGEGCRFRASRAVEWSTVGETIMFQGVAMAILGALVLGLVRVLSKRAGPEAGRDLWLRGFIWTSIATMVLLTGLVLLEQITCGVGVRGVITVLRVAVTLAVMGWLILALMLYARGLNDAA